MPGHDRFALAGPLPALSELGAVHILAIGGAGMSAVARLLLDAGLPVSGSDITDSPTLADLAARGARVHLGHHPDQLGAAGTVVVSSAIREDNPELAAARAAGLRVLHRSQALAVLMAGRRVAAVAGASGKTTTTAMLTHAVRHAGADPGYAIGGELADDGSNAALGGGSVFVVEADESDGSFLRYRPEVAVVTNVQPDHLDYYGSFAAVQQAYLHFAQTIRPGGLLVVGADDPGAQQLADAYHATGGRVLRYGADPGCDVQLTDIVLDGLSARCQLRRRGAAPVAVQVPAPGTYNLQNAVAAFVAATDGLGIPVPRVLAGLAGFPGVRRRFEAKGEVAGVRVVDDYAHNPGKVAAVVSTGMRLAPPGRLVVVFQPHLYSRTRDFAADFATALAPADVVVVTDIYPAREDPIPGVTGRLVADRLPGLGTSASYVADRAAVCGVVADLVRPGDLVVTVGAGDVTQVGPELLALLAQRNGGAH